MVGELAIAEPGFPSARYAHHAFLVEADGLPDAWEHVVTGDGDDAGLIFSYTWEPMDERLRLWRTGDDPVLPGLFGPT